MRRITVPALLALLVVTIVAPAVAQGHRSGTIQDLLDLEVKPFAIAHRGFGDNLGEDPSRPIENTVAAVRRAFLAGASVVEVDAQLTRDGEVVTYHDDFLPDLTCLNTLSFAQLRRQLPFVPRLRAVLEVAREFNRRSPSLSGLVLVELKAFSPLCDPDDTQERVLVTAVSRVVRRTGMTRQVMFTSFSPALLYLAAIHAPRITRDLTISGLQFLTEAEIEALYPDYSVTVIDKTLDLNLQWAEIGPVFRLPGYRSVDEVFMTAAAVDAQVVEADLFFLQAAGTPFVDALHAFGLEGLGFTATSPIEWFFLQALGLDGVYVNDVPFGVEHQAPIP